MSKSLVDWYRFCNDERGGVKSNHPDYTVGDIAKELGKRWGEVDETVKSKYEAMAEKDKARYERVRSLFHTFISIYRIYRIYRP